MRSLASDTPKRRTLISLCSELVVGERYCLIYASWFKAWQTHAKDGCAARLNTLHRSRSCLCSNSKSPGEIDNTRLLESDTNPKANIKEGLQEGQDYELVHESIWQLLFGWYGGGPCVTRSVISEVRLSLSFRPVLKFLGREL